MSGLLLTRRPAHRGQRQTGSEHLDGDKAASSILPDKPLLADLDALADRLRGRFVVQVSSRASIGGRASYRNAAAAERAVRPATPEVSALT